MLICPVCRSQNMDTAKFCGNCGNPFPRPSMPTSSLINCPQGHVYSAVYQFCPYCPQPEPVSQSGMQADFATRIEDPITAIEPPSLHPVTAPPMDLNNRAEPYATNFETRIGSAEIFETRVGSAEIFETRLSEAVMEEISIPPAAKAPQAEPPQVISAPTEVISFFAQTTIAEAPITQFEAPAVSTSSTLEIPIPPIVEPPPPQAPPVAPPPAPIIASPPSAQTVVSDPLPLTPPSVSVSPAPPEMDRRTIVVAEALPAQSSKGKIVGWLISYSRNPDGEDHRLYAGYNRIGANPVCDIVLEDETVSGSHAIIVYRDGRFLIKDDLSRNGTFVNGREISEAHPLQSYDQIRIGNTFITFIAAQRTA